MRVLYATDGSPGAAKAAALLEALADRSAAEVTVLTVAGASRSGSSLRPRAEEIAELAADSLHGAGFSTTAQVAEGRAAHVITQHARDHDVVVLGSRSLGWSARRLLGSVGTHVLHSSSRSVLIVHEAPAVPMRVIVAVDGSADARCAVEAAAQLLDPERCEVSVLAVAELLAPVLHPPYVAHAMSAPEGREEEVTAPAREAAQEAVEQLRAAGFRTEQHVVMGHPLRRLLAEAEEAGAALVVVGSRGLNPLDRVVLGSVSDQLTRNAPATLVGRRRSVD